MRMGLRALAAAGAAAAVLVPATARAEMGIFEIIHPDVDKGGFEFEALNTVFSDDDIVAGEERSVHEIALGYSPTTWFKSKIAVEIANPEDETAEIEAIEWENVFLFAHGAGSHDGHDHAHGEGGHDHGDGAYAIGAYVGLEVPNEAGIGEGAMAFGPIGEYSSGEMTWLGNLLVEVPFTDGEDAGFGYALGARYHTHGLVDLGVEAFGEVEEAFGDAPDFDQQKHFIGPALYYDADIGRGRMLETRFGVLAGLTDASQDLAFSINTELKF